MFDFRKKKLNPLLAGYTEKIGAALKQEGTAAKIESLLAVREEAREGLDKLWRRENFLGGLPLLGGLLLFSSGLLSGITLLPAGAPLVALLSMPVFIAGTVAGVAGFAGLIKKAVDQEVLSEDGNTISGKIGLEVTRLALEDGPGALKSPRFVRELLPVFAGVANKNADADYAELEQRVAPKEPAAVPAP